MNAGRLSFAKKSLLQATDYRSATNTWNQFHLIQEIFPGRLGTPPSVGGRQGARNPPKKILTKTWSEQSVTSKQKQTPCWKMDCPPSCSQPPFSGTHSKHQIYPPEIRETTDFSVQKMSIFRTYFEDDLYKNLFCRATTVTGSAKCCPHTERGHWVNLWSNIFSSYQGRNDFFAEVFLTHS